MKQILLIIVLCLTVTSFIQAQPVAKKIEYFPLGDVKLLDGEFKHIQDLTHRYLLTLEPDRLCSWFRREAGLTPKARPYPGWESDHGYIIPGHILGFYLSSMAMMYSTTGDPAIIKKLEYTLQQLNECQQAGGDGYIGAVVNGRHVFEKVITGDFSVNGGSFEGTNEPTYIMNKITLGLYDVYTLCHLPAAKKILIDFTNWFGTQVVDKLDDTALQKLLICEHGSLSESYIDAYILTNDKRFLDWAKRLNDLRILVPLSEGKDMLSGWHANCQIQKNPGFESVYRYSGEIRYTKAALFFWKTVVRDHSWIFGGNSTVEHFFPKSEFDNRVIQNGGAESCNSVNMLRLTEYLYQDYAEPAMLDYYERVLFNHILGAYEPERGMIAYMTKTTPGGFKTHSTEYDSFWCCTGTGFESPAKFQKMIYTNRVLDNVKELQVNLFIPSVLHWKEEGITLKQTTKIPDEQQTVLELQIDEPKKFRLSIRKPAWVEKIYVEKDGSTSLTDAEWFTFDKQWEAGTHKITVKLPMKIDVQPLLPTEKFISFTYGPVTLAAELDSKDLKHSDYWDKHDSWGGRSGVAHQIPLEKIPVINGTLNDIQSRVQKISDSPLKFKIDDYTLVPFNRIHYSRHLVYFPHQPVKEDPANPPAPPFVEPENLDEQTVDEVIIGNAESEKQHKMEAVNSGTGTNFGKTWRHATKGGYFMYELKSLPDKEQKLYFVFDGRDNGARTFVVQIDGKTVTDIDHSKPVGKGLYFYTIPIPPELTKGKSAITVKLQAKRDNTAGGILGLRVLSEP
ncbi:hypothetical protein FACS189419_06070 [Planctomycetales bacterium]|nr:hypothetical protein FACS189419_06070 [Planctomycetales bacterium]